MQLDYLYEDGRLSTLIALNAAVGFNTPEAPCATDYRYEGDRLASMTALNGAEGSRHRAPHGSRSPTAMRVIGSPR